MTTKELILLINHISLDCKLTTQLQSSSFKIINEDNFFHLKISEDEKSLSSIIKAEYNPSENITNYKAIHVLVNLIDPLQSISTLTTGDEKIPDEILKLILKPLREIKIDSILI